MKISLIDEGLVGTTSSNLGSIPIGLGWIDKPCITKRQLDEMKEKGIEKLKKKRKIKED